MRRRDRDRDRDKAKSKAKRKARLLPRRRMCRFCADKKLSIDYKDGKLLTPFTSERGRIIPRRISGNCAGHQREITTAIKRARILAIVPFSSSQVQTV